MRGPGYKQPPGWKKTVVRIMDRDDGRCYLCGGPAVSVDHKIAVAAGGGHDDSNLAAICARHKELKDEADRLAGVARRHTLVTLPSEEHPGRLALGGVPLPSPPRVRGV